MPAVFVYGPDTHRARLIDRLGACEFLGAATLEGHELVFDKPNMKRKAEGLANVREADGKSVEGILVELTRKQLEMLEGYFGGYAAKTVQVTERKKQAKREATVFAARRTGRDLKPTKSTLEMTIRGAEENALPRDFIERLRALETIDDD
jgi:hypothetical protein